MSANASATEFRAVRPNRLERSQRPMLSAAVLAQVKAFLAERGAAFFGEGRQPDTVEVQVLSTAVVARLRFDNRFHRVVVKPVALNGNIRTARELRHILDHLRKASPLVEDGLAPVLGVADEHEFLVMRYVEGERLETKMRRQLDRADLQSHELNDVIAQAARAKADIHTVRASAVLSDPRFRSHATFVESFDRKGSEFRSAFQAAGWKGPHDLLQGLSSDFFKRVGDRVALIDARPKNLIVRSTGGITFIDLDCSAAPPAMAVALFLAANDRLGTRHPAASAQRRLTEWGRVFVDAYTGHTSDAIGEDLTFFYPWAVLHMYEQHRRNWPWLASYLHWYYGRSLGRFLKALAQLGPVTSARVPAKLFES